MATPPDPGSLYALRYWRGTRWLFTLLGMGPRRAGVIVTESELRVRAWPLCVDVPLSVIVSAAEEPNPWWALGGVHTTTRGRWIVNAATGRVVHLDLAGPQPGTFAGIRIRVSRLDLGVADPGGLLRRLAALSANRLDGGRPDPLE